MKMNFKSASFVFLLAYFVSVFIKCDQETNFHLNGSSFRGFLSKVNNFTFVRDDEKTEVCLGKSDHECSSSDGEETDSESSLQRLGHVLFKTSPPLDLINSNVSRTCRLHSKKYINDLYRMKFWALQMYDSSAKLPSGLLNGNVNQLGDFDMCLRAEKEDIHGKYCMVSVQITPLTLNAYTLAIHRLTESHFHFRSDMDDPGHRVPRMTGIKWALCIPDSCTAQDISSGLRKTLRNYFDGNDWKVDIKVDQELCHTGRERREVPESSKWALGFFLGLILFTVVTTVYDTFAFGKKNRWIVAFSLRKNINNLISIENSSQDIFAIHGIRFINAIFLYLSHKSMAVFFMPYANRTEMIEFLAKPWTVLARAASLYTDPFIMFSGTLTAYSLLGKLERNKKINIFEEYSSRLMRIVPTFAALIAFCTFVLPWTNNGPMWKQVVMHHSDICKKYWWRNLLFIHNYFGFEQMCLTHTHHVGIDTQLFFVAPFLVLVLWKWPKKGLIFLAAIAVVSTLMRYYVTYTMGLNNYIHFGTSIKQLFATADNMYILPAHRATVYVMGVLLGYVLRKFKHIRLTNTQLRVGNAAALFSFSVAFIGPSFMGSIDYSYEATDAAFYAAFAPIFWCFAFAWLVFTTHLGQGGTFGHILSSAVFRVWTKISYTFYLAQFPVFFFNVGTIRTTQHYDFIPVMINIWEFLCALVFSCALTLLFEMPFQNIRNIIFNKAPNAIQQAEGISEKNR